MIINDLVSFCNREYKEKDCVCCSKKEDCIEECNSDCKVCLDDIHYHRNVFREGYSCERLLDYYVCRYSHKYCSEIIYALEQLDLSQYPYFNILSLGCGGAPDLMAFKHKNYPQKLQYYGLDSNPYWKKIHNYIEKGLSNQDVTFNRNIDVLEYFNDNCIEGKNIIIIQYLISYFYDKIGPDGVRNWFKTIAKNIVKHKPDNSRMLIIINDVDSCYTGRDTFPLLVDEIKNVGLRVSCEKRMRFKDENNFANSKQYPCKTNMFDIPNYLFEEYCVAVSCESVQLILEVE